MEQKNFYNLDKIIRIRVNDKWLNNWIHYEPEKQKKNFFTRKVTIEPEYFYEGYQREYTREQLKQKYVIDENNKVYEKPEVIVYLEGDHKKTLLFDTFEEAKGWAQTFIWNSKLKNLIEIEY